jgi:amino acid adenylation domain-containing protein
MYKTGDMARWTIFGDVEYIGRRDSQVKVRGFRVELGEIEGKLNSLQGVKSSVVKLVKDDQREILAAYVEIEDDNFRRAYLPESRDFGGGNGNNSDLQVTIQDLVEGQLPYYMVPSKIIALDKFPLTPNGKIDKGALPVTNHDDLDEAAYQAARDSIEEKLCAIWKNVLSLGRIGINDNFFSLGGHSLLATKLVSMIRGEFSIELPLHAVFEMPTVLALAERLRSQSKEVVLPAIEIADRSQDLPLSFSQQRLWFLDQLEEGSVQYNMPGRFRVYGELDIDAFKKALKEIIERHEVLRTHFIELDGEPRQVIVHDFGLPFSLVDLSDQEDDEKAGEIVRHQRLEETVPFDLKQDLMLRIKLLKLSSEDHLILFTMHHIASDGWSMGILRNEFTALYQSYKAGEGNLLPALKVQYADFALWQRDWLKGKFLEDQLNYWKKQLEGIPAVHSMPLDRVRPGRQRYEGKSFRTGVEAGVARRIRGYCEDNQVTVFMFLETVLSVLLSRFSQSTDIAIGSPIAGRTHQDTEALIGFFVNTLVIRTDLSDSPSFKQLLVANRMTILDAFKHQHIPFEMLVEEMNAERSLAYNPLVQIYLNFFDVAGSPAAGGGAPVVANEGNSAINEDYETEGPIKTDMTLYVNDTGSELILTWAYQTALFNHATLVQLSKSFACLINHILADDSQAVDRLCLLDVEKIPEMLLSQPYRKLEVEERTVVERLSRQCRRQADRIAITSDSGSITYGELEQQSWNVSRGLQSLPGYAGGSVIGVCMQRSIDQISAIIGVLKSGCAYLPLDPNLPEKRLAFMLGDSGAGIVIADPDLGGRLPIEVAVVSVAELTAGDGGDGMEAVEAHPVSHIVYTSGSTGQPKGVAGSQESLLNRIEWMAREFPVEEGEVIGQITSPGFIRAVWETFFALCQGIHLVIVNDENRGDPSSLSRVIGEKRISRIVTAPSLARELIHLTGAELENLHQLKYWFVSGEELKRDLCEQIYRRLPGITLCNLYGSTEVMSDVCYHVVKKEGYARRIPIGTPISNTRCLVLDNHHQPVPTGFPGELCIGGKSLAKEYIGDEELTREKFIDSPFADGQAGRLYRSGDYVRYLDDGNLEYLGRQDTQVKIRGFRIELSEIEYHLNQAEGIKSALVMPKENSALGPYLLAYLAVQDRSVGEAIARRAKAGESEVDSGELDVWRQEKTGELKALLRERLPEYMVPEFYIYLESFPLLLNGKIDKRELPELQESDVIKEAYVAPRNTLEETLCQLWRELLKVEQVGIEDNFFLLGGHSLLATRLISMIRTKFDVEMPLRNIFEFPTIVQLSLQIKIAIKLTSSSFNCNNRNDTENEFEFSGEI